MNAALNNWIDLLRMEQREADLFLTEVTAQFNGIVERNAARIFESIRKQQLIAVRLSGIQRLRDMRQREVSLSLGLSETRSVTDFVEHLSEEDRAIVVNLARSIKAAASQSRAKLRQNQLLMSLSMEQLQQVIRAVSPKAINVNTYGSKGDKRFGAPAHVVSRWQVSI